MATSAPSASKSAQMARVRSSGTDAELRLRSALWRRGLRYVLRRKLPGRPDVVFVRARLAVFVDGCFWHGCPTHYTAPKANDEFWRSKLSENVDRDRRVDAALRSLGWTVLRLWEHEIEADVESAATRVERAVRVGTR
jgi:DNA mismatch endonuclease (patch repair protein)